MLPSIEIFDASVVFVGDFNPAIFSPDWLERNQLLGSSDAQVAREDKNLIISHEITRYETDWFHFQVLQQQFSVSSKGVVSLNLRDLAIGITSLVPQTPVRALGLNFMAHYKMQSLADYHKLGDVLAPKNIWNKLFQNDTYSAGLEAMTIRIDPCKRGEEPKFKDAQRITLQPSSRVTPGVFFSLNNHFDIGSRNDSSATTAEQAVKIIGEQWETSVKRSTEIFESVIASSLK